LLIFYKLTDNTGFVVWQAQFDSFGRLLATGNNKIDNPLRFPGQYFDAETGLHYNWHRYYDPELGRYISSDPIGLAGGMNTYLYANGNSLMFYDPYGLFGARDAANFVPVLGSALDSYDALKCGNYGMAALNAGLAILDLTGGVALVKGLTVGSFKWSQRKALKQVYAPYKNGRTKSSKFNNIRSRMKTAGLVDGRDVHHWWYKQAQQRAGDVSHEKLNQPWNLMPNMSETSHYKAHHGNVAEKAWGGTPGWAKLSSIGAISYASGMAINSDSTGCECN
jgi:RHS repeat-associated protein